MVLNNDHLSSKLNDKSIQITEDPPSPLTESVVVEDEEGQNWVANSKQYQISVNLKIPNLAKLKPQDYEDMVIESEFTWSPVK